jgi:hypothetical protein
MMQASSGEATLTRCTLRKHAGSPNSLVEPDRLGAVVLDGPTKVTLQHCYVEVGGGDGSCDQAWIQAGLNVSRPAATHQGPCSGLPCQMPWWVCELQYALHCIALRSQRPPEAAALGGQAVTL